MKMTSVVGTSTLEGTTGTPQYVGKSSNWLGDEVHPGVNGIRLGREMEGGDWLPRFRISFHWPMFLRGSSHDQGHIWDDCLSFSSALVSYSNVFFFPLYSHNSLHPIFAVPAKWTSIISRKSSQIECFRCGYRIYSEIRQRIWQASLLPGIILARP